MLILKTTQPIIDGNDCYYCWLSDVVLGNTITMSGIGKNYRGDGSEPTASLTVELKDCYVLSGSSRYGEYTHCSNGGTKVFGCPQWNGMGGGTYTKTVAKTKNNQFQYIHSNDSSKNIYYENGYWVVGKRNSYSGWWETSSQPSPNSPINLTFHKPANSDAEGQDYTLSFIGYVAGNETTPAWVGDVAKWQ